MVSAFSDSLAYSSLVGVAVADATERSNSFYFSAFSPRLQHSSHSSSYFSVTTTKTTTSSRTLSNFHPRFSSATTTTQEQTPSRSSKKISLFPSSRPKSLFATFAYPRCRISRAWQSPGVTSALRTVRSLIFARFRNTFEAQIDGAICTRREREKERKVTHYFFLPKCNMRGNICAYKKNKRRRKK